MASGAPRSSRERVRTGNVNMRWEDAHGETRDRLTAFLIKPTSAATGAAGEMARLTREVLAAGPAGGVRFAAAA